MDSSVSNYVSLNSSCVAKQGLATADNNRFLRICFEVENNKIGYNYSNINMTDNGCHRWFPYNKGGESRKWYGNQDQVVDWERNGFRIKHNFDERGKLRSRPQNTDYYFKPSISWSLLASSGMGFRIYPSGFIYDVNGMSLFPSVDVCSVLGFLNSSLTKHLLKFINPTMACQIGDLLKVPCCIIELGHEKVQINISISKQDWDTHETSWDFEENELIRMQGHCEETGRNPHLMEDCYRCYQEEWTEKFNQLHKNEEELNRQFIEIYGLEDELTPDVPLDEITILQQGEITIE